MAIESTTFTRYCPEVLELQSQVMTAELVDIIAGFRHPLPKDCGHGVIHKSLGNFIRSFNHRGLNQLASNFAKQNASLPEGGFYLSPPVVTPYLEDNDRDRGFSHRFNRDGTGYFYIDGEHGFALGWKDQRSRLWISVTSFLLNHHLNNRSACYSKDLHYDRPNSALIVQLQAPSFPTYSDESIRQRAFDIAGRFHWESVLTSLVVQWAESIGLDSVSILPASMNKYQNKTGFSLLRAKILYDANARRCGFKKDSEGFYSFDF